MTKLRTAEAALDAVPRRITTVPTGGSTGKPRGFLIPQAASPTTEELDTREADVATAACTVHAWCIETGAHEWHSGEPVQIAPDCDFADSRKHDHSADFYIDAKLIAEDAREPGESGAGPVIAFGDCEVTADGMRAEAAKIRAALPRLEALADTLDGRPPYTPPTDSDTAESIRTAGARGAILSLHLFKPWSDEGVDERQKLAVYAESGTDDELDLDGALDFRNQLAALLPKLDVMIGALAAEPQTEPPKSQKAQPGGTWTITTANGFTAHGYLPPWAENDPSKYQIPADRLQLHISDVVHARWFDGQEVTTNVPDGDGRATAPDELLGGHIACRPYSDTPVERVPHVNIEVLAGSDEWIEHLDPDGVADVAAKLRAQAARLDQVREQLIEACADWAANGGAA